MKSWKSTHDFNAAKLANHHQGSLYVDQCPHALTTAKNTLEFVAMLAASSPAPVRAQMGVLGGLGGEGGGHCRKTGMRTKWS